jgi:hypothetical protein
MPLSATGLVQVDATGTPLPLDASIGGSTQGAAAPSIAGSSAGQTVSDVGTIAPFASVTFTDPNANQTDTVTISLSSALNGTLSNLGGGSYNPTLGIYTDSGSAAAITAAVDGLVFSPTAHEAATG